MRKISSGFLISLGLLAIAAPCSHAALRPAESDEFNGQEAPAFYLRSLQGKDISLKEFKGRPVLLNFFASWCPPCRGEIGELMKLREKYAAKGLVVIGAASDSKMIPDTPEAQEKKDVAELIQRLGVPYPVVIATQDLAKRYQFKGIPTTVFIGRSGAIEKVFYGYHDADQFEGVLQRLVAQKRAE